MLLCLKLPATREYWLLSFSSGTNPLPRRSVVQKIHSCYGLIMKLGRVSNNLTDTFTWTRHMFDRETKHGDFDIRHPRFYSGLMYLLMVQIFLYWVKLHIHLLTRCVQDKMNEYMLNENCIFIPTSLKYIPRSPIINKPELVQIMAWRRPLYYLRSWCLSLLTHICVTRLHWVNTLWSCGAILRCRTSHNWLWQWPWNTSSICGTSLQPG